MNARDCSVGKREIKYISDKSRQKLILAADSRTSLFFWRPWPHYATPRHAPLTSSKPCLKQPPPSCACTICQGRVLPNAETPEGVRDGPHLETSPHLKKTCYTYHKNSHKQAQLPQKACLCCLRLPALHPAPSPHLGPEKIDMSLDKRFLRISTYVRITLMPNIYSTTDPVKLCQVQMKRMQTNCYKDAYLGFAPDANTHLNMHNTG